MRHNTISITLSEELCELLTDAARRQDITLEDAVETALNNYVDMFDSVTSAPIDPEIEARLMGFVFGESTRSQKKGEIIDLSAVRAKMAEKPSDRE